MDDLRLSDVEREVAVVDESRGAGPHNWHNGSPAPKSRSLSDGGGTPKLSPSPHIVEARRRQSKDDIAIRDKDREPASSLPSTPIRAGFGIRGSLSLHMQQRDSAAASPAASPAIQSGHATHATHAGRTAPLSPQRDHIYATPTNILPRRSRGMDFSRAATSLHHSTVADQGSPDCSPTIGSRAVNIPGRHAADYGAAGQTSTSLWSMMGNQERMQISSSVGSTSHVISDLSSSSDNDDFMDEDMEEAYVTTPQAQKATHRGSASARGAPWMPGSPMVNNLSSFQQLQRQRKHPKKKPRGPLGLGFHSSAATGVMSRSPPNNLVGSNDMSSHARRESISWAANQLHISGNDSDDNHRQSDGMDSPLRPSIVRRTVTRRGNLLPKTKGFARIRAALAEESAPIEAEFRREAEVVRQVRESDMDLEPRQPPPESAPSTALSSPNLATHDSIEEISDDLMMMDPTASALGLSGAFKQQALKNSKGKVFWDTFSETSSTGATQRTTPPPPPLNFARASSTAMSLEDISMGSPSASSNGGASQSNPFAVPGGSGSGGGGGGSGGVGIQTTASSSGDGTPLAPPVHTNPNPPHNSNNPSNPNANPAGIMMQMQMQMQTQSASAGSSSSSMMGMGMGMMMTPPTAAEITRRINNSKRRRGDDDLDPVSIKRRAVSPGMSVHNSPVMQSPLQRDSAPWGTNTTATATASSMSMASRPGSVGGDSVGGGGRTSGGAGSGGGGGGGTGGENGGSSSSHGNGGGGGKLRVGFRGMVETHDGITRLSIE